ncbi:hypothetical protein [Dyadobacter pollutisoli]|uniref:Uncharacterized protein n=1 Tax=Dyadobacter pollutisoli TaxID=2910158 RepID=A0A9E8SQ44_9BACT|nr:hypothetical protein [Dyadobacter pollutisoli]WAC15376.1 hypothetical protein ON006_15685 [Dyadobacter pollutisoli]
MEAIDNFSTLVILLAVAIASASIIRFIYNIVTDKGITVTNVKTGKSATITRTYNKSQVQRLSEVLS